MAFTGISGIAFGQHVAGVVEMHHLFQALEVAVMHVGLHKVGRGAHVDIAQGGYLKLGIEFWSHSIQCESGFNWPLSLCSVRRKPPTPMSMKACPDGLAL